MMGYMQAQDRFFQMDVTRRQGSGTLAELVGAGPGEVFLATDIQWRAIGIRRSAERSLSAYSPGTAALILAYSDGVNAWLDNNPLPPEYTELEITQVPRWTPLDSVTVSKFIQFQVSFDTLDLEKTGALLSYQAVGQANGFDGTKLFFEDIFRFAPFDTAVTVPSRTGAASLQSQEIQPLNLQSRVVENARRAGEMISPGVREAARKFVEQYKQNPLLNRASRGVGSNWWVVAGSKTDTRNAMLASDPHVGLGVPTFFYEIHLTVDTPSSPMNVYGVSHCGSPGVIFGQNDRISWGGANAALDVTDFFVESLVVENGLPVATLYKGGVEPLVVIPEVFKSNQVQNGIANDVIVISPGARPSEVIVPPSTLIVPRRNNGPLTLGGPSDGISLQFAGASATRELEAVFALARARNVNDFKQALQFIDVGSLNWVYADVDGNIATFTNGKIPLREDLREGTIDGLPPFFLRDGTGAARNEWIPRSGPGFNYESLPFEEMPQSVNPVQGFLVNANNDPIGITLDNNLINQTRNGGIYYISAGFNPGFRAAKITSLLKQKLDSHRGHGKVSFQDMQSIQNNVQMFDAEVFTPYIIAAFNRARHIKDAAWLAALAKDPAVREAVERLSNWDFSSPTGIIAGYDAADTNGVRQWPSHNEVSNSIAATIYSVWRSQILANTIIATLERAGAENQQKDGDVQLVDLRFLLDNFSTNRGKGASGLDFFEIPGINASPEVRRDGIILKSLKSALDLLASAEFADAFNGSTNQNDYRWGKLHRISFGHFLGLALNTQQFNIPTAGNFMDLSPALQGLAVDGGFETIDNGPSDPRSASSHSYVFASGVSRRYVGELRPNGIKSAQIIPGGESGVLGNRFYADQLSLWLTNDYHRVLFTKAEIDSEQYSKVVYRPVN